MSTYNAYFLNGVAGSNVNWFGFDMTFTSVGLLGGSVAFTNSDGSLTILHGDLFGFSLDDQGVLHGTIRWITRTDGVTEYEAVGSTSDFLNIDATAFQAANIQQRYDLVFGRPMVYNGDVGWNTFSGHQFSDQFFGFGGRDTVTYANAPSGVVIDMMDSTFTTGYAAFDQYFSIERIVGSNSADSIYGHTGANQLLGGDGNDIIVGRGGGDILRGGNGDDIIDPGPGGNALVFGEGGDDTLIGGGGMFETLDGHNGSDTASYASNTTGVMAIITNQQPAEIWGTATNAAGPQLFFDNLRNVENLIGGSGNDYFYIEGAGDSTADRNTFFGNEGNDWIEAGPNNDQIFGGGGLDVISYIHASGPNGLVITLGTGGNGTVGSAVTFLGVDTYSSIEGVEGTNFADTLTGNERNNVLYGRNGDDVLNGGMGSDQLIGGDGFDTLDYSQTINRGITLTMFAVGEGTALTRPNKLIETDAFTGIEKVIGTTFDDKISGHDGSEVFEGGSGNDVLVGGSGNDTLSGGGGADTLIGDADWGFQGGNEQFGDDTLSGGTGDDIFNTGNGNNTVEGGGGRDTLDYSWFLDDFGNVEYMIDANLSTGVVTRKYFDTFGGDTFVHGTDTILDASTFDNVTGTIRGDSITGNAIANILIGLGGNDAINGGGGRDTIDGGTGNDTMTGGGGADFLQFTGTLATGGIGHDVVTDFTDGADGLRIYTGIADSLSDFTIIGNGTTSVTLKLDVGNSIVLQSTSAITITNADITFFS